MGMARFTTVPLRSDTLERLERLRRRVGARSWDELLRKLADAFEEYEALKVKESVRKVMCNDNAEMSGTLKAWLSELSKKLSPSEVAEALTYLVPSPRYPGEFVVDIRKCLGE